MDVVREQLDRFLRQAPRLDPSVYVANGGVVVGAVTLGARSSVWYHAVLRADINTIMVGEETNIQDQAVLHVADDLPCRLGNRVTVGHSAVVHACTVEDEVLVGMGAVILDGAVIGRHSIIGARTLVKQGMEVPPGSLVLGSPGRVVRQVRPDEVEALRRSAAHYAANAAYCLENGIHAGGPRAV